MRVRPATEADLPQILAILNREIREGVAHFGTEEQTLEQCRADFGRAQGKYPWYVACIETSPPWGEEVHAEREQVRGNSIGMEILGFARASPWKSRGAYSYTAEIGIYVATEHQGKGVGKAIYAEFVPALEKAGLRTILAGIGLPNDPSIRLHEAFGFEHVGTLPRVGFKLDKWHDVGYWALCFGEANDSQDE